MPSSPTRVTIPLLLHELFSGPASIKELMDASGIPESTLRMWFREMRKKDEFGVPLVLRVAKWETSASPNRAIIAYYELNVDGLPDAKRPRKSTPAQRQARYRERMAVKRLYAANGVTI